MHSNYHTCFEKGGEAFNPEVRLTLVRDDDDGRDYIPEHDLVIEEKPEVHEHAHQGTLRFSQVQENNAAKDEPLDIQRSIELRDKQTQQFMQILERRRNEQGVQELQPIDSRADT